jgi:uncharacterized protein YcbK (DUF882 family)
VHKSSMNSLNFSRRQFIKTGLVALSSVTFSPLSSASLLVSSPRSLQMSNIHTGEKLHTEYFNGHTYQLTELQKINSLCRDFRRNETINMDKGLFDQLSQIQRLIGCDNQVQIISGYRSPATNDMLRKKSGAVAKKSLHMQGRAIDFRLAGIPLVEVKKAAQSLKAGGVGYYPKSDFVHIDTGHPRYW